MRYTVAAAALIAAPCFAEESRTVFLETGTHDRIAIAELMVSDDGNYSVSMHDDPFTDHFLSMRPFKCLEGPSKHWCFVPYPYEIKRDISQDLTDLEYDFLFVWKGATEYGIDMWNGVYYRLETQGDQIVGTLHEMDMNGLAVPPSPGDLRPILAKDLHESDPDSHWLPRLIIE